MLFRRKTKKTLPVVSSSAVAASDDSTGAHALQSDDLHTTLPARQPLAHAGRVHLRLAATFEQGLRAEMEDAGIVLLRGDVVAATDDDDDDHVVAAAAADGVDHDDGGRTAHVTVAGAAPSYVRVAHTRSRRVLCAFGVFDGHGGGDCSARLRSRLADEVVAAVDALSEAQFGDARAVAAAVEDAFMAFDRRFYDELMNVRSPPAQTPGSTALLILVLAGSLELLACNVGDCRAVLRRIGPDGAPLAVPLSRDHLPSLACERTRVHESLNGFLRDGLVNGVLQMTRAFGDFELKSPTALERAGVIAKPEIRRVQLCESDTHVMVACDGLWDVCTSRDVVKIASETEGDVEHLCSELVRTALARGSADNTSLLVMQICVDKSVENTKTTSSSSSSSSTPKKKKASKKDKK